MSDKAVTREELEDAIKDADDVARSYANCPGGYWPVTTHPRTGHAAGIRARVVAAVRRSLRAA